MRRVAVVLVIAAGLLGLTSCVGPSAPFFPVEGVSAGFVEVTGCFPTNGRIAVRVDTSLTGLKPEGVFLYTDFRDSDTWESRLGGPNGFVWEGSEGITHSRGACGSIGILPHCETTECAWTDSAKLFTYSVRVIA